MQDEDENQPPNPIVNRLRRADGHLRHIIGMVEGNMSPNAVAQQLQGVEQAIRQAKKAYIQECLDLGLEELIGPVPRKKRDSVNLLKDIAKYL